MLDGDLVPGSPATRWPWDLVANREKLSLVVAKAHSSPLPWRFALLLDFQLQPLPPLSRDWGVAHHSGKALWRWDGAVALRPGFARAADTSQVDLCLTQTV